MARDYIDRKMVLELCDWYEHEYCECDIAFGNLYDEIKQLPISHSKETCEDMGVLLLVDEFVCSACGVHLTDWRRQISTDDGEYFEVEYVPLYCPNCGAKIERR